jgi:ABC-2 type transport system permease protein
LKQFYFLVVANVKEMTRDWMQLLWFLGFPLVFSLIFGVVFSNVGKETIYEVGIAVQEESPLTESVTKALSVVPTFRLHTGKPDDELQALQQGERALVVVLPPGLAENLAGNKPTDILLYAEGSNALLGSLVGDILNRFEHQLTGQPHLLVTQLNVPEQQKPPNAINQVLPGILAMTLMQLGLFGSLRIASLRERKTLKLLGATMLPRSLFLASEVTVRMGMSVVQAAIIIIVGRLAFGLDLSGHWLGLLGWVVLGTATFVSMGYALVSMAKTVDGANGLIQVVQFVMMFLSGIFIPMEQMPDFLHPVVKAMPLTYLADGMRYVMSGTASVFSIPVDFAVLAVVLVICLASAVRFRWE